eukprot:c8869_g1_i1.p1 GENE.c8869_g1_i1~~c8869_g1_i1.p1  ORF type:complete len:191 (-),score=39.94 c8869_g1_i1:228-800(-)
MTKVTQVRSHPHASHVSYQGQMGLCGVSETTNPSNMASITPSAPQIPSRIIYSHLVSRLAPSNTTVESPQTSQPSQTITNVLVAPPDDSQNQLASPSSASISSISQTSPTISTSSLNSSSSFVFISLLGRGGFGKVFRVADPVDGREFALKRIPLSALQLLDQLLDQPVLLPWNLLDQTRLEAFEPIPNP